MPSVNFGSYKNAMSSDCSMHLPLVKAFTDYCLDMPNDMNEETAAFYENRICESLDVGILAGSKTGSAEFFESLSKLGVTWNLLLAKKSSTIGHPGIGRIVDPEWADINMVKKWKQDSLKLHSSKCATPMKIPSTQPAWLVDVRKQCVVPGLGRGDYVALSYRWGETLDTTRHASLNASMAKLQEPKVLCSSEVVANLAPIVRQAICLTSLIQERYLWVDALCIDHSDIKAMTEELNAMGIIYASAVVTIVALDSDSQTGFLGLKGVSNARKFEQKIIPFREEQLIFRNTLRVLTWWIILRIMSEAGHTKSSRCLVEK